MKFHIVRNKETLEDILYIYNLTKGELVEQNKHIRVWDKLIPGTKLKIPPITEAVELEVSDIEPFVEDYYPSLNEESITNIVKQEDDYKKIDDEIKEEIPNNKNLSSKIYEEYEEISKPADVESKVKITPKISEDEEDEEQNLNRFSNRQTRSVLNNYYPYYLGVYNAPRYIPYPIVYYPVYYPKKPN